MSRMPGWLGLLLVTASIFPPSSETNIRRQVQLSDRTNETSPTRAAAWTAPPSDLNQDLTGVGYPRPKPSRFKDQTIRQIERVSVDGNDLRFKFSNIFGTEPLKLDKVRFAQSAGGGAIDPSTNRAVTFNGASSVTIPAGQECWSDPVAMQVAAQTNLAVSIYLADAAVATGHPFATTMSYIANGDETSAALISTEIGKTQQPVNSSCQNNINPSCQYYLSEIDVERAMPTKVVVAFGDSITSSGAVGTVDSFISYPDQLAKRALSFNPNISIVNQGIGGNRWLHDKWGTKGVTRFARDVLGVTGVTDVIILLGVNDLNIPRYYPRETVTADQIIAAMTTVIQQAKARNVKIFMGTILPDSCALPPVNVTPTCPDEREAKRQAVNAWIRSNKEIAVVDFDKALRDPANPLQITPSLRHDDIHPNAAGNARMAAAVDLSSL